MLLHLPPELIQIILQHCTTPAFVEAAFSCRALYEVASTCREALLCHLRQTPGFETDIQLLDSKGLFQLLIQRASQNLYGAQFHADCTTFNFDSHILDVKTSTFAQSNDTTLIALAKKGHDIVSLFRLETGALHLVTHLEPFRNEPGAVQILRTAFDKDNGVYVLQRFTPVLDRNCPDTEHPFVRQALQTSTKGKIYLIRHPLQNPDDPIRVCDFPDHVDFEPLAVAAGHEGIFAISWQHVRDHNETEVVLYNTQGQHSNDSMPGLTVLTYDACVLLDNSRQHVDTMHSHPSLAKTHYHHNREVIDLTFNDRSTQLLYYYKARALYGSFQRVNTSSFPVQPTLYNNACPVQFSESQSLLFSIDIPFFGTHTAVMRNGRTMCKWKYLAFGIATHRSADWTVGCLLRSEALCSSHNCGHNLNLERGRRFSDWTVVARLWGFQNSTNSIGSIVATSKRGTRIAVANWNILYIWALEPNAVIEQNANGFYPSGTPSECPGQLVLRPIIIQLHAVCFRLHFVHDEDQLLAITDRGLMHWNLSPSGKAQRMFQQLPIST